MRGVNQSVPEANPLGSSAKVRQTGAVKAWRVSRYGGRRGDGTRGRPHARAGPR